MRKILGRRTKDDSQVGPLARDWLVGYLPRLYACRHNGSVS